MGLTEIIAGSGILAAALWLLQQFVGRGSSSNVKEKAEDLAAKRRETEAMRARDEISSLRYNQLIESIEKDEERLKRDIKNTEDINVPDSEVDDADANELARRLADYTS